MTLKNVVQSWQNVGCGNLLLLIDIVSQIIMYEGGSF